MKQNRKLAGLRRRVERQATSADEVADAAEAHEQERIELVADQDRATGSSEYLGALVYGALDGIITTFAIVSGVAGASLSPQIVLILGIANLLGDGFSMAAGAFLSARSEQEVYTREREHIAAQVAEQPDAAREELYRLYLRQNYPDDDARQLARIKTRDPGRWVSALLGEKLLLSPEQRKPLVEGVATFTAFVIAGAMPLLVYGLDLLFQFGLAGRTAFLYATLLSGLTLLGVGAAKFFVTGRSPLRSGIEMVLVGGLAAAVAYAVGALLKGLAGTVP